MNINSSITSATAYIIITTAVIITIDDVFVNITNIPANKDIIDNVNTTAHDCISADFNFNDMLIFISPAYAIHIPIIILTMAAKVVE